MTPAQAQRVLATMLAGYPSASVDEAGALVWADHLRDIPADGGMKVAHRLIRTQKWFPTVSEFRDAWAALRRVEQGAFAALPAGGERMDVIDVRDRIDELKRKNDEAWTQRMESHDTSG